MVCPGCSRYVALYTSITNFQLLMVTKFVMGKILALTEYHLYEKKRYQIPIIGCNRSAFLSTKFPRYYRASDDHICVQNHDPINILCIFTMFKPVHNSSRFVNRRIPAKPNKRLLLSFPPALGNGLPYNLKVLKLGFYKQACTNMIIQ